MELDNQSGEQNTFVLLFQPHPISHWICIFVWMKANTVVANPEVSWKTRNVFSKGINFPSNISDKRAKGRGIHNTGFILVVALYLFHSRLVASDNVPTNDIVDTKHNTQHKYNKRRWRTARAARRFRMKFMKRKELNMPLETNY